MVFLRGTGPVTENRCQRSDTRFSTAPTLSQVSPPGTSAWSWIVTVLGLPSSHVVNRYLVLGTGSPTISADAPNGTSFVGWTRRAWCPNPFGLLVSFPSSSLEFVSGCQGAIPSSKLAFGMRFGSVVLR